MATIRWCPIYPSHGTFNNPCPRVHHDSPQKIPWKGRHLGIWPIVEIQFLGWFATNDKGRDLRYDNFSGAKWWVSSDFAPFYWNSQCSMLQSPCLLGTPSILATKTVSFSAVFAGDISILLLNHVKLSNSHFSRANFKFWMIFGCRDPHDPHDPRVRQGLPDVILRLDYAEVEALTGQRCAAMEVLLLLPIG